MLPQNSKCQKSNTQQVPYWGLTNIGRYCTKFIRHGELGSGICAPCIKISCMQINPIIKI